MLCEKCGKEIPNNAVFCPNCGTKVLEKKKSKKKWLIPLCVVLGAAIVGGGVFAATKLGGKTSTKKSDNKTVATQKGKTGKKEYQRFREVDGKIEVYLPVETHISSGDGREKSIKATYNSKGLLEIVEGKFYEESTSESYTNVTQFQYTDAYKIEEVIYSSSSGIYSTTNYEYDAYDNLLAEVKDETTPGGNKFYRKEFDATTGKVIYNENGWGYSDYFYEFDEEGYVTKVANSDGSHITYIRYDENHRVNHIQNVYRVKDMEERKIKYPDTKKWSPYRSSKDIKYDKNGLLLKVYDEEYKYDKFGNAIEIKNSTYGIPDSLEPVIKIKYKKFLIDKTNWDYYYKVRYPDAINKVLAGNYEWLYMHDEYNDVYPNVYAQNFLDLPVLSEEDLYTGNFFRSKERVKK